MNIAKKIISTLSISALTLLVGCTSGLTNLTPAKVPENSSSVYTLSFSAHLVDGSVIKESLQPFIVIDGQTYTMKIAQDLADKRIFEYDYVMPKGRTTAKYYFILKYKSDTGNLGIKDREIISPTVYELNILNRYVVSLQSERGAVGSSITILGNGFDRQDKVAIGDVFADTQFVSRTTLNFIVPPLDPGKNYDVEIVDENDSIWIGSFRVDSSELEVSPSSLTAEAGNTVNMILATGFSAPEGGFAIDVKTNIPSALTMPEVVIPEGQTSVVVPIEATAAATGALYINAKGFKEKVVPVEITQSATAPAGEALAAPAKPAIDAPSPLPAE